MQGYKALTRVALIGVLALSASMTPMVAFSEQAVAPEHNPPGDIPDNQVFIRYVSPAGYELQVPEGWARKVNGDKVSFADKYDVIEIVLWLAATAPTINSVRADDVSQLLKDGRAVTIKDISIRKLKAGPTIRLVYESNSEPNSVTGKQTRLDNERFFYFRNGKLVTLDLAAPTGADNVDQWQLISNSFRWK